jgi:hypothetical protein
MPLTNSKLLRRYVNSISFYLLLLIGKKQKKKVPKHFFFQSLVTFVNKHLNKVNLEVADLDTQFHDGVYLTLLMGLLEGFFVPLYSFHLTPHDFDHKVHNVSFAFQLMQDVGLAKPKARPEGNFIYFCEIGLIRLFVCILGNFYIFSNLIIFFFQILSIWI